MSPILFEIGPFRIATYGVMLAIGFLCGLWVLRRELAHRNLDRDLADRIVFAAMIGGIIGGKAFHLMEYPQTFLADPLETVFSGYGLAWYGGFLGGAGAVLWTIRRHNALDWATLDAIAPGLVVGYFFGRGGCELSGDGCYGMPTDLPWGKTYPIGAVPTLEYVHPTPLYEMLQMACIFGLLWALRDRFKPGILFGLYLILMAVARFCVEFLRRTPEVLWGLTVHQWVSMGLVLVGLYLVYHRCTAKDSGMDSNSKAM
jgi:phosphatidylglycerol---prolipoprotein diacylglyceryl transferase